MMNIDVSVLLNQEAVNMTGSTHSENSELFTELLNQHLHKNEEKTTFLLQCTTVCTFAKRDVQVE